RGHELDDCLAALQTLRRPTGGVTLEFPHLMRLREQNQFDTIYHQHFSYFSLWAAERAFAAHGLTIFDVDELPTHGGSLRIYARHAEERSHPIEARVMALRAREVAAGVNGLAYYAAFEEGVRETQRRVLALIIRLSAGG